MGQIESGYAHSFLARESRGSCASGQSAGTAQHHASDAERQRSIDVFPKEPRCSLEALIIAPKAGLMIVGWIDDVSHPLHCIRIIGPTGGS
jgi:hypothetical protein